MTMLYPNLCYVSRCVIEGLHFNINCLFKNKLLIMIQKLQHGYAKMPSGIAIYFDLILYVPVNNFSVMLGRVFLG